MNCIIDQKKISDDRFKRYPRAVTCSPECSQISQTRQSGIGTGRIPTNTGNSNGLGAVGVGSSAKVTSLFRHVGDRGLFYNAGDTIKTKEAENMADRVVVTILKAAMGQRHSGDSMGAFAGVGRHFYLPGADEDETAKALTNAGFQEAAGLLDATRGAAECESDS